MWENVRLIGFGKIRLSEKCSRFEMFKLDRSCLVKNLLIVKGNDKYLLSTKDMMSSLLKLI